MKFRISSIKNKTEEELDQIFGRAFDAKVIEIDISGNNLTEIPFNVFVCSVPASNGTVRTGWRLTFQGISCMQEIP